MIQFNLLPDVKLQYIKATYRRRVISIVCFLVAGVFLFVFILMFLQVKLNQPRILRNLDSDITAGVNELRSNPDLDKILTIQSQLESLPVLHEEKVMGSRIFDYVSQVTPTQASITNIDINFVDKSVTIKGLADNLTAVNTFVDTLKFTEYSIEGEELGEAEKPKAFSSVVLSSFDLGGRGATEASRPTYQVTFSYDEAIFRNTSKEGSIVENSVKLSVPAIISTRSEILSPENLFQNEQPVVPTIPGVTP